jgi:circadian clock protein KaiC
MSKGKITSSERVSTGIEGLDYILKGGLPKNRLYLVEGNPGTGKTTMGLTFLLEGERSGENGRRASRCATSPRTSTRRTASSPTSRWRPS